MEVRQLTGKFVRFLWQNIWINWLKYLQLFLKERQNGMVIFFKIYLYNTCICPKMPVFSRKCNHKLSLTLEVEWILHCLMTYLLLSRLLCTIQKNSNFIVRCRQILAKFQVSFFKFFCEKKKVVTVVNLHHTFYIHLSPKLWFLRSSTDVQTL